MLRLRKVRMELRRAYAEFLARLKDFFALHSSDQCVAQQKNVKSRKMGGAPGLDLNSWNWRPEEEGRVGG